MKHNGNVLGPLPGVRRWMPTSRPDPFSIIERGFHYRHGGRDDPAACWYNALCLKAHS